MSTTDSPTTGSPETDSLETNPTESDAPESDSPKSALQSPTEPVSSAQEWLDGPAPAPIIIGILGLLAALASVLAVIPGIDIRWGVSGPALIIGFGALVIVLGLLSARRARQH